MPAQFSQKTIEGLLQQSDHTQLYICPECGLQIFYPQIIGISDFYTDLLRFPEVYHYLDDK